MTRHGGLPGRFAGTLGRGDADDWSDIDLLVVVPDALIDDYGTAGNLPCFGDMALAFDARQNAPRGCRALSIQYLAGQLPLWVDWYIYPASHAGWVSDSAVLFDSVGIEQLGVTFAEHLHTKERQEPTPKTEHDHRMLQLALVPVAGKRVARRSPDTPRMVEFVGGPYAPEASPLEHLGALRRILDGFRGVGPDASISAGHAYLDLVEVST